MIIDNIKKNLFSNTYDIDFTFNYSKLVLSENFLVGYQIARLVLVLTTA